MWPDRSGGRLKSDRVNLPETGCFSFFPGVERAYGNTAFQSIPGFGEAFPLHSKGILVFFQIPVYGRRPYPGELFGYCIGDLELQATGRCTPSATA
jgi:hypothetical protein